MCEELVKRSYTSEIPSLLAKSSPFRDLIKATRQGLPFRKECMYQATDFAHEALYFLPTNLQTQQIVSIFFFYILFVLNKHLEITLSSKPFCVLGY